MSKSKARAQQGLRQGGSRRNNPPLRIPLRERIPFGVYMLIGGILILGLTVGLPVYLNQRHMSDSGGGAASGPTGPSVAAIGQPAPGFSLKDPYGQTYTLTPGDGKAHLLVFYMGNF